MPHPVILPPLGAKHKFIFFGVVNSVINVYRIITCNNCFSDSNDLATDFKKQYLKYCYGDVVLVLLWVALVFRMWKYYSAIHNGEYDIAGDYLSNMTSNIRFLSIGSLFTIAFYWISFTTSLDWWRNYNIIPAPTSCIGKCLNHHSQRCNKCGSYCLSFSTRVRKISLLVSTLVLLFFSIFCKVRQFTWALTFWDEEALPGTWWDYLGLVMFIVNLRTLTVVSDLGQGAITARLRALCIDKQEFLLYNITAFSKCGYFGALLTTIYWTNTLVLCSSMILISKLM